MKATDEEIEKLLDLGIAGPGIKLKDIPPQNFSNLEQFLRNEYGVKPINDSFQDMVLWVAIPFPNQDNIISEMFGWPLEPAENRDEKYWRKDAALLISVNGGICTIRKEENLRDDIFKRLNEIIEVIEKNGFIYIPWNQIKRPCPYPYAEGKGWDYVYFDIM